MGNQRISDLTPIQSGSLDKNLNVIPVVSGNETYQLALTDLQSDIDAKSLQVSGSVGLAYNTTLPGAWSTGGALSQPRYKLAASGEKTSALAFGGYTYSTYIHTGDTEAYDGTSWSVQNSMIQGRSTLTGFGSQNATTAVGGTDSYYSRLGTSYSCTEEYDGLNWSAGGALIIPRAGSGGAGTQNAGVVFGGYNNIGDDLGEVTCTEKYDGTTWSSDAALNHSRYAIASTGTQNAALGAGGASDLPADSFYTSCTETYDGTAWSAQSGLSVGRYYAAAAGTQNDAIVFGGANYDCDDSYLNQTEKFDGTSWSTDSALTNGRYGIAGAGSATSNAFAVGGTCWDASDKYCMDCTEEYTDGNNVDLSTFTFNKTTGNISAQGSFTGSVQASSLEIEGSLTIPENLVACNVKSREPLSSLGGLNSYNDITGTRNFAINSMDFGSFSTTSPLLTSRLSISGLGSQDASLVVGGFNSPTWVCTEEYNGTNFSTGGALINGGGRLGTTGTQNAALATSGYDQTNCININCTEFYNGTTWSAESSPNDSLHCRAVLGIASSALAVGGYRLGNGGLGCTEFYNGTTWSSYPTINSLNNGLYNAVGAGLSNSALVMAGGTEDGLDVSTTRTFDGTTWSFYNKLILPMASFGSSGGGDLNNAHIISAYGGPLQKSNELAWYVGPDIGSNLYGSTSAASNSITAFGINTTPAVNLNEFGVVVPRVTISGSNGDIILGNNCITSNEAKFTGDLSSNKFSVTNGNLSSGTAVIGSFTLGGNLITPRINLAATGCSNSDTIAFGGLSVVSTCTEEYNGSTWAAGGALISGRYLLEGTGTQNATLSAGGRSPSPVSTFSLCTEEYDGSTWSAGGSLINGRESFGMVGTQNAALAIGGYQRSGFIALSCTEEYNGTSWAASTPLPQAICGNTAAGRKDDAITFGAGSSLAWDGSAWSYFASLQTPRSNPSGGGNAGLAYAFGGGVDFYTRFKTEAWNGLTWNNGNNLLYTASSRGNSSGDNARAVYVGTSICNLTQEVSNFFIPFSSTSDLCSTGNIIKGTTKLLSIDSGTRAWSTGGNLNIARGGVAGAGPQNNTLAAGGDVRIVNTSVSRCTEEYDGTSWSVGTPLNQSKKESGLVGDPNNALSIGGRTNTTSNSPFYFTSCVEEKSDGTWSYISGLTQGGKAWGASAGTTTAALMFGGRCGNTYLSSTEEYDGSSWTASTPLINVRAAFGGFGSQNAALAGGGFPNSVQKCTEEYDGSTWSAGGTIITNLSCKTNGTGTQNAGVIFGPSLSSPSTGISTLEYDGSTWTSGGSMINPINQHGASGFQSSALSIGGVSPASFTCYISQTEEYNSTGITETTFEHTDTGRLVFSQISSSLDFASDSAAAAGGVPLGGIYRNGGDIKIRLV